METTEAHAKQLLATSPVVAVLGAHPDPTRPAHYVPAYLTEQGYDVRPVNPRQVGSELFGHPVVGSLVDVEGPVDLVDVFRRAEALPDHVDEILAMSPLPRVVWFQLGIRNDVVAEQLRAHGIEVVQDRCTLADHRRFGLGQPKRGEVTED